MKPCALLILVGAGVTAASANPFLPDAGFVQFGTAGSTRELSGGLQWDWSSRWELAGGEVSGHWELSAAQWQYRTAAGRNTAWLGKLGAVPVFRYAPEGASHWFLEFGIGLTLMTTIYETDRKRFSTAFNFGDHLGVGRRFGSTRQHELVLRVEHFSNASIKHPNPGENFVQLRYVYRLR